MKKIFTFLCLLMLGAGMSAWAQKEQILLKNTRSDTKESNVLAKITTFKHHALRGAETKKNSPTMAEKASQGGYSRRVSPIRRSGFNELSTYGYWMAGEENENHIFTLSETTITKNSDREYHIEGNSSYNDGTENLPVRSELILYTAGETSYLPSGLYNIETSGNAWTCLATTDEDLDNDYAPTFGAYKTWYNKTYRYMPVVYALGSGTVYVVNPDHASKPNYIGLVGIEIGSGDGYQWWSDFGTEPNKHTVTFTWGNNGTDDGNNYNLITEEPVLSQDGDTYTLYQTSVLTLTPIVEDGYAFVGWTGTNTEEITDNLDGTYKLVIGDKDYSIAAVFEAAAKGTVAVSVSPEGAGYVDGTAGEATFVNNTEYPAVTSITLTAHNNSGYRFVRWTDGNTNVSRTFSVNGNASLTAEFIEIYTISTDVKPAGTGNVTGGGANKDKNSNVMLSASSSNEHLYFFDHWEKDGSPIDGDATIERMVTADASYTAVFRQANDGTITASASPLAGGSVVVNQSSTAGGTAVTLNVEENAGYKFSGWADGGNANPRTVYVDGTKNYVAQFVERVSLNLLAGCNPSSPLTYRVLLPDYEVYFKAGNSWSYGDGEEIPLSDINTSASYIKDHGTTVTIGNDVYAYTHTEGDRKILQLNFTGSNGKYYQILLRGANYNDCTQNFDQTFTNLTAQSSGTGWRILYADNGVTKAAANASFGPNHWDIYLPVYIDESKCGSENNGVPSGIYPILDTDADGTIRATIVNSPALASGYWTCQNINQTHKLVTGYMDLVNRDGNTYAEINGYTSSCYPLHCVAKSSSSVGVPVTINCTAGEGGSANIVWHSANCGDVTYTAVDMPQKFFNGNTITLTATANSGYEFWRWSDEASNVETSAYGATRDVTVSGNTTLQAIFREAAATYTVTFNDYNGTQLQSGNVEENTQPTIASPTRADDEENNIAYSFIGWKSSADDNVYATANLPVATAAVTYTAQYEPYFLLLDDKADNNDPYYAALGDKKGEKLNVKYMRSFTKDTWAVFSLPFNYSFQNPDNNTFREQVYYLISAKYTSDGYLTLNCMPNTYRIEANKPYILIPKADIENPTFKGVKMQSVAHNYYTAPNTEGIGTGVEFRNTTERETLAKDQRVIYVKDNTLYYPNMTVDSWMRPFRGYFYLNIAEGQIQYSPARVRLVNEEGETIETLPEASEETSAEVKKYIENGILVIERAGVKYDAQGHKLN